MIRISRTVSRTLLLIAASFGAPMTGDVRAQCMDWAYGFGPTGNGLNGMADCMTVFDDGAGPRLFVGGGFTTAGGTTVNHVASWDGSTWAPVGSGFNSFPLALAAYDDGSGADLYATGYMLQSGATSVDYIARWNGTSWSGIGGLSNPAKALAVFDDGSGDALYVGGAFITAGGVAANRIAKWDGTSWSALGMGTNDDIEALAVYDDGTGPQLYAAGGFTMAGGIAANHIARWNGTSWSSIGTINGFVEALEVFDAGGGPELYAGGTFTFAGGVSARNVARWNGTTWARLGGTAGIGGGVNGWVRSLAVANVGGSNALYVGGGLTGGQGFSANYVAKWNGSDWSALGTGLEPHGFSNDTARSICGFNDGSGERLFVGGSISKAGGKASEYFAKWGVPCTAPVIVQQPVDQDAVFQENVVFTIVADATAPVTYQWRRYGTNVSDGGSSIIEGATTPTLTIFGWSFSNEGIYDCVVTNSLGSITSAQARLTVPAGGVTGEPVTLTRVIYPPEPVPGLPDGNTYTLAHVPTVSSSGDAFIHADINGGLNSLSLWRNGAIQLLYKAGDQAPGLANGILFSLNSFPAFNSHGNASNGQVVFRSPLEGPGVDISNRMGIWYRDLTATDLVARTGNQPVDTPSGAVFSSLAPPRVSNTGHVVYSGAVQLSGSHLLTGIWDWNRSSGSAVLAKTTTAAPGTSANFVGLSWPPIVNDLGTTLFQGELDSSTGFNYSSSDDTGLWRGTPGAVQLVVKSGDQAAGYAANVNLEFIGNGEFVLNDVGDVAFKTMVAGPSGFRENALYRVSQGVLTRIAHQGMAAPGAGSGATFVAPFPMGMNNNGTILFESEVMRSCADTCPTKGLWVYESGVITPILMNKSGPLPGLPASYDLAEIESVAINDLDQVVFECFVFDGNNQSAVYGWSPQDGVFPIALPGAQFEVSLNQYRTAIGAGIASIDGSVSNAPISTSLTNSGLTVLGIGFSNGTAGLFAAQFQNLESLYFPPGEAFCFGDGSLTTACPCVPPNVVPDPSGAPDAGCANSFSLDGAKLMVAGDTTPDSIAFTGKVGPNYAAFALLIKGNATETDGVAVGDGIRCAGGQIIRFGGHNAGTNGAPFGSWTYPNTAQTRPVTQATAQVPNQHAYYQLYYRNAAPNFCTPATANMSNGIDIFWPQ